MKHARSDYNRIQDPAGLIPADEPVFLIRAKDMVGPAAVLKWAEFAEAMGADADIVQHARAHVADMIQWQKDHGSQIPDMPPNAAPPATEVK